MCEALLKITSYPVNNRLNNRLKLTGQHALESRMD